MIRILILAWTLHLIIQFVYGVLIPVDHFTPRFYNEMEWNPASIYLQKSNSENNIPAWRGNIRKFGYEPKKTSTVQNQFPKKMYPSYGQLGYFNNLKQKQDMMAAVTDLEACNGFDNILNDMGIMSLVIGIIGAALGIITDGFSIIGILISIISVLWAGGPSTILALLNRFITFQNQLLSNIVEVTGMLDTFLNIFFNIRFSTFTTLVSHWGNVASVISILLGVFELFPEELEKVLNFVYGKEFIQNYGCDNPYRELAESISTSIIKGY